LPAKLKSWFNLSYKEFLTELEKRKVKLSLKQKAEWEENFNSERRAAAETAEKIAQTNREINLLVCQLYGLTE
jgi:hypothetical protein